MFEMLVDKPFAESPKFVEILAEDQRIDVYHSSDNVNLMSGKKVDPIDSFNLLNLDFPCKK